MDANHVFPQCVLVLITLIGGAIGLGISKACSQCDVGISFCSMPAVTLGVEVLRVRFHQVSLLLSACPAKQRGVWKQLRPKCSQRIKPLPV